jgi:hypothetical protein
MNPAAPTPTIVGRRLPPAGQLLATLLAGLRNDGLPFVVGGDPYALPMAGGGSVDLIVGREQRPHVAPLLAAIAGGAGARIVQITDDGLRVTAFSLAAPAPSGRPVLLTVRASFGTALGNLDAHRMIARRRTFVSDLGPFPIPPPDQAFLFSLIQFIEEGDLGGHRGIYLSARWDEDPAGARALAAGWFDARLLTRIEAAATHVNWRPLEVDLDMLQEAIESRQPGSAWQIASGAALLARRLRRPPGLALALLGADAAVRRRLLDGLQARLAPLFRRVHREHVRRAHAPLTAARRLSTNLPRLLAGDLVALHGDLPAGDAAPLAKHPAGIVLALDTAGPGPRQRGVHRLDATRSPDHLLREATDAVLDHLAARVRLRQRGQLE